VRRAKNEVGGPPAPLSRGVTDPVRDPPGFACLPPRTDGALEPGAVAARDVMMEFAPAREVPDVNERSAVRAGFAVPG